MIDLDQIEQFDAMMMKAITKAINRGCAKMAEGTRFKVGRRMSLADFVAPNRVEQQIVEWWVQFFRELPALLNEQPPEPFDVTMFDDTHLFPSVWSPEENKWDRGIFYVDKQHDGMYIFKTCRLLHRANNFFPKYAWPYEETVIHLTKWKSMVK